MDYDLDSIMAACIVYQVGSKGNKAVVSTDNLTLVAVNQADADALKATRKALDASTPDPTSVILDPSLEAKIKAYYAAHPAPPQMHSVGTPSAASP